MGRTKVQHELISNEITRKITFKKRKVGLLKKLKEITTLCGVVACGIIFHNFNFKPKVWPSVPEEIIVLKKFKGLPQKKQKKNMFNHETLLDKSLKKMTEKLDEEIEKNKWMEMELMLTEDLSPIGEEDLNDDAKEKLNCKREMIKTITKRI
ncbi:Agamous-like MADS-box protein AGL80 [Linum perenne]